MITLPYFDLVAVVVIAVLVSLLLRRRDSTPKTTRGAFNLLIRHTHELTPDTVAQLGVMLETTAAQVFAQQVAPVIERVYPARKPAVRYEAPPEPEERLAHDMRQAHAVLRGAQALQAAAKDAGRHLPMSDALQQAAAMLDKTYGQEPT